MKVDRTDSGTPYKAGREDLDTSGISSTDPFLLGKVKVDGVKGEVIVAGNGIHLAPKAIKVLIFLCQQQGRLVSVDEILSAVWRDSPPSRASLSHIISDLRHALGDSKSNPIFIETIPRQGYRIIAEVSPLPDEDFSERYLKVSGELFDTNEIKNGAPKSWYFSWAVLKSSRLFSVSIGFIIFFWVLIQVFETVFPIFNFPEWALRLAVLIFVAGFPAVMLFTWVREVKERRKKLRKKSSGFATKVFYRQFKVDVAFLGVMLTVSYFLVHNLIEAIESDVEFNSTVGIMPKTPQQADNLPQVAINPQSVAIMPFSLKTGSERHYFSENLQTELIDFLSGAGAVDVFSKRAVNALSTDSSLEQIVSILGARYVLDGQVGLMDSVFSVTLSITDTTQKIQLWSTDIQGAPDNLLLMQEEIFRKVLAAISMLMPDAVGVVLSVKTTSDYLAYDDYLQGKNAVLQDRSKASLEASKAFYMSALNRDPAFAQASAALCQTYVDLYELVKEMKYIEHAKETCDHALQLSNTSRESQIAIADLYLVSGEYQLAEKYYSQVLDANQSNIGNSQEAAIGLAHTYAQQGLSEQAEQTFLKAIKQAPAEWYLYYSYGVYLFGEGRYSEAIAPFIRVTILAKQNASAFNSLGGSYYMTGNFLEAGNAWYESLKIAPSAATYSNLGTAYYFQERFDESREAYQHAINITPEDGIIWTNLGDAEKFYGDQSNAIRAYKKALSLSQQALSVNPNDYITKALIAKLYAETGDCKQALTIGGSDDLTASNNPYVYHDLAVMAERCLQLEASNKYVSLMIELGYPLLLLAKDPAFSSHAEFIKEMTSRQNRGRS